jgi:4-hydroxyphenylpyruvate dioxygenase
VQAALQFEDSTAPLLPIPINYYDDLSARLGLDDATLASLQKHGLLYDRDVQGDFMHFYTDPFQDRFFFEVVERRDGYGGFGAANSSVRAAAQARQHTTATPWL